MSAKKKPLTAPAIKEHEDLLRARILKALTNELEDCAIPDLAKDPVSGGVWRSLPTVDSKTAFKISASIIEEVLGCQFKPMWIRKGGYSSIAEATDHIISQLEAKCAPAPALAAA
jgi:hypothetical protein